MSTDGVTTAAQRALLHEARRAVLATIDPQGHPRLVPICFVLESHAAVLWTPLDEKPKVSADPRELARVRDILERPTVSVLVDRWDEDWTRLAWVRILGTATLVGPGGHPDHGVNVGALRAKYGQYTTHRLEIRPLIRIRIDRVSRWGDA